MHECMCIQGAYTNCVVYEAKVDLVKCVIRGYYQVGLQAEGGARVEVKEGSFRPRHFRFANVDKPAYLPNRMVLSRSHVARERCRCPLRRLPVGRLQSML